MEPPVIYRRARGTVTAVPLAAATADVRANTKLWPWAWLGRLYGGLTVITPNATYALSRSALREVQP